MITLSDSERKLFAAWLAQEITTDAEWIVKAGNIGFADAVTKHYQAEMLACEIVRKRLLGEPG